MKNTKQTLILAALLLVILGLGLCILTLYDIRSTVKDLQDIAIEEGKKMAEDAGEYLKETHGDDLKHLSQEQVDSLKSKLDKLWK